MEVIQQYIWKAGFPAKVDEKAAPYVRKSSASLPKKVVNLLPMASWQDYQFMEAHYSTDFFVYPHKVLGYVNHTVGAALARCTRANTNLAHPGIIEKKMQKSI